MMEELVLGKEVGRPRKKRAIRPIIREQWQDDVRARRVLAVHVATGIIPRNTTGA